MVFVAVAVPAWVTLNEDDLEDLDDAPDAEVEEREEEVLDQATAAQTLDELRAEIATLTTLESHALAVRRSGVDTKWTELANLLARKIALLSDEEIAELLFVLKSKLPGR